VPACGPLSHRSAAASASHAAQLRAMEPHAAWAAALGARGGRGGRERRRRGAPRCGIAAPWPAARDRPRPPLARLPNNGARAARPRLKRASSRNRGTAAASPAADATLPPLAAAFLATLACFPLTAALSARAHPPLRRLPPAARADWASRGASTAHAVGAVVAAAILLPGLAAATDGGRLPITLVTSPTAGAALAASFGYFLADALLVAALAPALGGADVAAHHAAALLSLGVALATGQGHAPTLALLACEVTTPFVNARAWLDRAGARSHPLYAVNGLILVISWAVGRLGLGAAFLLSLASPAGRGALAALDALPRALMVTVPAGLYCLNVWWFAKIARGAAKMLQARRAAPAVPATPPPPPAKRAAPAKGALNLWASPPGVARPRLSPGAEALASLSAAAVACRLGAERAPGRAAEWARRATAAAAGFVR